MQKRTTATTSWPNQSNMQKVTSVGDERRHTMHARASMQDCGIPLLPNIHSALVYSGKDGKLVYIKSKHYKERIRTPTASASVLSRRFTSFSTSGDSMYWAREEERKKNNITHPQVGCASAQSVIPTGCHRHTCNLSTSILKGIPEPSCKIPAIIPSKSQLLLQRPSNGDGRKGDWSTSRPGRTIYGTSLSAS